MPPSDIDEGAGDSSATLSRRDHIPLAGNHLATEGQVGDGFAAIVVMLERKWDWEPRKSTPYLGHLDCEIAARSAITLSTAKTDARMSSSKVQATTQQKAASNESTINSWTLGFTSTLPDHAILRFNAPLCIHIWNTPLRAPIYVW
jgi:hypothetical protein